MNDLKPNLAGWHRLGQPPPAALTDARNQLHWAAQVVASVGYTFAVPAPDFSHTSLVWLDDQGAFASQWAPGPLRFRAALCLADLTLLLLDEAGDIHGECRLAGRTLEEGYAWLASAIATMTRNAEPPSLVRPGLELPDHPTGHGAAFSLDPPEAFAEVARWYANADLVLQALSASSTHASPVLCWPHHFDTAVLFSFDPDKDAEEGRSLGVGLVPGDGSYAEPYWYLTPYPVADNPALPPLDGQGFWRKEGWFGAVLTATTIIDAGDAHAQARRVTAFLRSALAASRSLLGLAPAL